MYRIKRLPHTADIRIRIEADSQSELFEAGLKCIGSLLKEDLCAQQSGFEFQQEIEVVSADITTLLIDFLSDVLTKSYEDYAAYCKLTIHMLTNTSVRATIYGKKIDGFDEDIKAVTYHEAEVERNESGKWQTNVVFDI